MKKKIFSTMVALVMFISFFSGMEASATSQGVVYEVSTADELMNALMSSQNNYTININSEIQVGRGNYDISAKNIRINFNGNKVYGLCLYANSGSIVELIGPGML